MECIDIIVIDEDGITAALAESYLKELALSAQIKSFKSIDEAETASSGSAHKIMLVNVENFDCGGFKKITALAENKNINIAAIAGDTSANLQVKAFRAGVKDFLSKPLIKAEFISAIQSIYRKYIYKADINAKAVIYTAVSESRGAGKSFFLLNLAREIAEVSSERVLLLDFNNSQDRISSLLKADIVHNAEYYINNLTQENAQALLADVPACINAPSLYIIAENFSKNKPQPLKKEHLASALKILKEHFKYILIDKAQDEAHGADEAILDASNEIFCVILPEVSSMRRIKRIIDRCGREKSIRIILNQYSAENASKIEHIQSILGREIFWKIPKNFTAVNNTDVNNSMLKDTAEGTDIIAAYLGLAKYLADRN